MTVIPLVVGALGTVIKGLAQGLKDLKIGGVENVVEIGQNTKKSPGDLKRLVVTQPPLENHQIMLVWKNSEMSKIIIIIVDFTVSADHWVKLKESEKRDKY